MSSVKREGRKKVPESQIGFEFTIKKALDFFKTYYKKNIGIISFLCHFKDLCYDLVLPYCQLMILGKKDKSINFLLFSVLT